MEKYYKPVQDFIDNNKVVNNNVKLRFNVTISVTQFKEEFMKYIDMGKTGTFFRDDFRINEIIEETGFDTLDSVVDFTKK